MSEQVEKWIANKVCRHSNSPYGTPAFVIEHIILTRAISEAYGHWKKIGLAKYNDDIDGGHDSFKEHLELLGKLFEVTHKHKLKFTRLKCNFAVQKIKLLGRIMDEDGDHPDPNRIIAVQRYETLNSIHEVRSFLEFANTLRRYIKNFTVISKSLTNILKKSKTDTNKSKNKLSTCR